MAENILTPDPERFGQTKGREMLPSTKEKFKKLEAGRDYKLAQTNELVESEKKLDDCFVFVNPSGGDIMMDVHSPHWRTATFPDVHSTTRVRSVEGGQFIDRKLHYYAVNVKGCGFLKPSAEGIKLEDYDTWTKVDPKNEHDFGYQILGLAAKDEFLIVDTMGKAHFLNQSGLRGEEYWGVAKLNYVYYKGQLTSIDDLRKKNVILKRRDYQPHMAVRLLKTNDRIAEATESEDRRKKIFSDAFAVFNREVCDANLDLPELDIKNLDDQARFFNEFFRRMGGNMAVLLNVGYIHYALHSANVTMAAEIADISIAQHWKNFRKYENYSADYDGVRRGHLKDMRDIVYGLRKLLKGAKAAGLNFGKKEDLVNSFMDGFDSMFKPKYVKEIQKTNPSAARQWMEAILKSMVIENKRLPNLTENEVEDWGISNK